MTTTLFKVTQASILASWQDGGRYQSAHHGVTEGGSMDCHAAYWANHLLQRDARAPVIEITMGMFAIEFHTDGQIAITGADLGAQLNQVSVENWQSLTVAKGDILSFAAAEKGVRAYLAVNADIQLPIAFNSVSSVMREISAGLPQGILQVGDTIMGWPNDIVETRSVAPSYIPDYQTPLSLLLIPSYQFDQFSAAAIDTLLTNEYQIQPASSRSAILLEGKAVEHDIVSLASEGIAYGSVQIPPSGQPLVLLNDRQTMGGYPKPGCISRLSGAALAQRFAPTKIRFELTTIEKAQIAYQSFLELFKTQQ